MKKIMILFLISISTFAQDAGDTDGEGDLGDDVVFALVKQEDVGSFKMPTVNEGAGANNNWISGGKTSGGANEAIIKTEGMVLDVDYNVIDL